MKSELLTLVGLLAFFGAAGGRLFHSLRIPQILGYVVAGVLLGPVLGIMPLETVQAFEPFNLFALGVIGFIVGGELKKDVFTRFGKQVTSILLFEGLTAFALVGILSFLIMLLFFDWKVSFSVALVFAAICAATDPASTVNVLWEYKTRGPLTTMLTAIVALDDALAMTLYAVGVSVASMVMGHQETGFWAEALVVLWEIVGSLIIGITAGWILSRILKQTQQQQQLLIFLISGILLLVGVAILSKLDVIITLMATGATLINLKNRKTELWFELVQNFAAPIYVLFFVLVGARLQIGRISPPIALLVGAYVGGSIVGKTVGSYWGAAYSGTVSTIKKYLGYCLYPQGGIAIGLLIMASSRFDKEISSMMLLVVILGAFVLQILGPLGVKFGATKAGEIGLNITEDDLIKKYKVGDAMEEEITRLPPGTPLSEVIRIIGQTDQLYYPVVNDRDRLLGCIDLEGMRNAFATESASNWLVAIDVMEPVVMRVDEEMPLETCFEKADSLNANCAPVISREDGRFVGIIDFRRARRRLSGEVLSKQKEADFLYELEASLT